MSDFWGSDVFVWRDVAFVVRGVGSGSEAVRQDIREAVRSVSPDLPLVPLRQLSDLEGEILARHSLVLWLLTLAGGVALVIGVVGLYGALEYAASQRLREFGLRLALRERPQRLRRGIVLRGVLLAGTGVVLGIGAATAGTGLLSSLLFRTSAVDPMTYASVSLALIAVAALASQQSARRATRVSPAITMRPE